MASALVWGLAAACSLLLGAALASVRPWRSGLVGAVLAFGAGALVSGVAYDLAQEGLRQSGALPVAVGLGVGAVGFYAANRAVHRLGGRNRSGGAGLPLAVGALLDGIPEQAVLGIGLASGQGVSVALLVAIFVSNLPEAIGSSADMLSGGRSKGFVLGLWAAVAAVCTAATVAGFAVADVAGPRVAGGIDGFAAGALLVMLVDEMIPEARSRTGNWGGLVTVLGFALAAGLSQLT
jgi:ZIP family zinc transporter